MKKATVIIMAIVVMLGIMYGEYRYIMTHIRPINGNNNTIYLEIFNQVDEYYVED
jgi:hypothetical protein